MKWASECACVQRRCPTIPGRTREGYLSNGHQTSTCDPHLVHRPVEEGRAPRGRCPSLPRSGTTMAPLLTNKFPTGHEARKRELASPKSRRPRSSACASRKRAKSGRVFERDERRARTGFAPLVFIGRSPTCETRDTIGRRARACIFHRPETWPDPRVKGRCFPGNAARRRKAEAPFSCPFCATAR